VGSSLIRAMLIAFAIATLICAFIDQPAPVKTTQVDYCVVTYKRAAKDERGVVHFGWAKGWGPCTDLDRYEFI
jgi:hypothetical protein